MFGHVGFSYIGLLYLAMLFIPNIVWTKHKPQGYSAEKENRVLAVFEGVGQILVTCGAVFFSDFNIRLEFPGLLLLAASFTGMIFYELYWMRYFRSRKTLRDFYSSFAGIPVAGATLPVVSFLLLGFYGRNVWMILSVLILGIGHIGIHREHYKEAENEFMKNRRGEEM